MTAEEKKRRKKHSRSSVDIEMASNETAAFAETEGKMPEKVTVKKRERRPNYTPEEKTYLAQLVSHFQSIIDDKRTGGIFVKKKREAWKAVTLKYNSKCTTGQRETEHLKMLYDNMKQQARRNDGQCFTNTTTRLPLFRLYRKPELVRKDSDAEEDGIKTLQQIKDEQEKDFGFYKAILNDSKCHNSTAHMYTDNNNHTSGPAIDPIQFLDVSLPESQKGTSSDPLNTTMEHNSWHVSQSSEVVGTPGPGFLTLSPLKRSNKPLTADALERLYYRKKCRNANLERKKILQEIFHAQQKHNLEMTLLRRALEKP